MTRLPRVSGTDVVRALERDGFLVVRRKGTHVFLRHADGRTTLVPLHASETIGPGLLSKILREVLSTRSTSSVCCSSVFPLGVRQTIYARGRRGNLPLHSDLAPSLRRSAASPAELRTQNAELPSLVGQPAIRNQ